MTHAEKRLFLIRALLDEEPEYQNIVIPSAEDAQNKLLRSLFNVRMPGPVSEDFLKVQDEFLKEETSAKGITELPSLTPVQPDIYLWQGDITTLSCDAIVNAANAG